MSVVPMSRAGTLSPDSPLAARLAIRRGEHRGPTAGMALGYVQGNIAVVPNAVAADFLRFCQLNPKPCPLIGCTSPGDWRLPSLAEDLDLRTDVPRYRVWRHGELVDEPYDVVAYWRDDLVAFVIGCSFSFEEALLDDGIELRHIACGRNVSMYRTSIPTEPAGPFHGQMVVSMRPLKPADVIRAVQITTRFPALHGAPVHIGKPELIGIADLAQAGLWRRGARVRRRAASFLGLRRDPAVSDRGCEAGFVHHALSRQHADYRPPQQRIRSHVVMLQSAFRARAVLSRSAPV